MSVNTACQELLEHIVELVEGDLGGATAARLNVHADACSACARQVSLQRRLVVALRAQPAAPDVVVPVPNPEPSPVVRWDRLKVAAVAAIAAGLLVVTGARLVIGPGTPPVSGVSQIDAPAVVGNQGRIEIRTVVDSTADVALPDDDLLALTAGVEAVVMRRPTQRR